MNDLPPRQIEQILSRRVRRRQLEIFAEVYRQKNISAAAKQIPLAQSTVSKALGELENALGAALFHRSSQGLTPTQSGDIVYRYTQQIAALDRSVAQELSSLSIANRGIIRIGCATVRIGLVSRALVRFKKAWPEVTVQIHYGSENELFAGLDRGEYQAVFSRLLDDTPANSAFSRRLVFTEPTCVLVRSDHPVLEIQEPRLADLASYPWCFPFPNAWIRRELDAMFTEADLAIPANVIECTSLIATRSLLVEYPTIVSCPPLSAFRRDIDDGLFVPISIPELKIETPQGWTWRAGDPRNVMLDELMDAIDEAAR